MSDAHTPEQRASAAAAFAREFFYAATRPSLPPILGAIAITAVLFITAISVITPQFMATVEPGMLMSDPYDQYGFTTVHAFRTRANPPPASEPTVILLGASGFQHAVPSESLMTSMLSDKLGRDAEVINLTAGGSELWAWANLIDFVDDTVKGVYVVNVSITKLGWPDYRLEALNRAPHLGLRTDLFNEEVRQAGFTPPKQTGIYAIDNFKFLLARLKSLKNLVRGPVEISRYSLDTKIIPQEKMDAHIAEWIPYHEYYWEHHEQRYASLERLVEEVRSSGSEIILLQSPTNPLVPPRMPDDLMQQYQHDIHSFSEQHDVPYWNLNDEANFQPEEFRDRSHVIAPEARERFADVLMSHLAHYLRERDQTEAEP